MMLFVKYLSDLWQDRKEEYDAGIQRRQGARGTGAEPRAVRPARRVRLLLPLRSSATDANIGELINIALEQIEDANKAKLEGVFRNIDFNTEPNLGQTKERNRRLKNLLEDFQRDELDLRQVASGTWTSSATPTST